LFFPYPSAHYPCASDEDEDEKEKKPKTKKVTETITEWKALNDNQVGGQVTCWAGRWGVGHWLG